MGKNDLGRNGLDLQPKIGATEFIFLEVKYKKVTEKPLR